MTMITMTIRMTKIILMTRTVTIMAITTRIMTRQMQYLCQAEPLWFAAEYFSIGSSLSKCLGIVILVIVVVVVVVVVDVVIVVIELLSLL